MHAACLRRRPAAPSATRVQICAFKNDWIYIINRGLPPPLPPLLSARLCALRGRSLSPLASRRSNNRGIGKVSARASLERDMNRMHARTLSSLPRPRPPAPRFAPPHRCEGGRLGEGLRFTCEGEWMLGKFGIFAWASERANGLARPIGGAIDFRGIILEDLLWSPALSRTLSSSLRSFLPFSVAAPGVHGVVRSLFAEKTPYNSRSTRNRMSRHARYTGVVLVLLISGSPSRMHG